MAGAARITVRLTTGLDWWDISVVRSGCRSYSVIEKNGRLS